MKKYNEFLKEVFNKENREDFRTHSRKKYIVKKLSWLIDNYDFVIKDLNEVGHYLILFIIYVTVVLKICL